MLNASGPVTRANGTAAAAAELQSRNAGSGDRSTLTHDSHGDSLSGAPGFVAPPWFTLLDYLALLSSTLAIIALAISEAYFSSYRLQSPLDRR